MKNSLKWSFIGSLASKFIGVVAFVLIARILPPSDFGVVAILSIIFGFTRIIVESGFKEALIFYKIPDNGLSAIFLFLLAISLLVVLMAVVFREDISLYFNLRDGGYLLYVIPLLVLSPFRVISIAQLESNSQFKSLAIFELIATISSSIVGVYMAYDGLGILSLIMLLLINEFVRIILYYYFSSWSLSCSFSLSYLKKVFRYSYHLLFFNLVNFSTENIDKIIINKSLGIADTGLYSRAQQISSLMPTFVSQSAGRVIFPVIASIKDKKTEVFKLHLNSLSYIILLGFPFVGLFAIYSQEFVALLIGDQWLGMVPILKILLAMSMFQALGAISVNVYTGLGKTQMQYRVNLLLKFILLFAIILGSSYGLVALVYGLLFARMVNFFITQYFVCMLMRVRLHTLLLEILPVVLFILIFSFTIVQLKDWTNVDNITTLVAHSLLFVILYFSLVFFLFKRKFLSVAESFIKQ